MDDRRFDDLTKFVGRRASRRAVVKAAAAAALAAVFGGLAGVEAAPPVQGGVRQRVKGFCNAAGQPCKNSLNPTRKCCYRCNGSGKNAKCCEAEGYACTQDSQCCDGRICRDPNLADGVKLKGCFTSGTLQPGAQCLADAECASGACLNGSCCAFEHICYNPNTGLSTCCGPCAPCIDGVCEPIDCSPFYDGCIGWACDPATGQCTIYVPLHGIPCDDSHPCTLNDTCFEGECRGTAKECDVCMDCSPATGECEYACGNCEECDPYVGCVSKECGDCEACDHYTGECVLIECG